MTNRAAGGPARQAQLPDGSPGSVVRRAPFANNPVVGERGQLAQDRILSAALEVFGEVGYHQCHVHRITELAGCSRVSFYQYFSSKEDLFRHLAGRVARRLAESVDALGPVTADADGRDTLLGYFERFSTIYDEYQPIFVAFQTAASADTAMADGAQRVGTRVLSELRSKVVGSPLSEIDLDGTVRTIIGSATRANRLRELIEGGDPPVKLTRKRLNASLAEVCHRALFGVIPGVNLTTPARRTRVFPTAGPAVEAPVARGRGKQPVALGAAGAKTRAAVLEAGHQVYVERGYYGTRVDDIATVAGVSHGVFYRYFRNKDELFRLLARQASERVGIAFDQLDDLELGSADATAQFRAWLQHYAQTCAESAAIMRVWVDAITRDPQLGSDSVGAIEDACRGIIDLLARRGVGDAEPEAVVMLVFLEEMTSGHLSRSRIEGVGGVIERSLVLLPETH